MKILLSVLALVLVSIESVRGNGDCSILGIGGECCDDHPLYPQFVFWRQDSNSAWEEYGCIDSCCDVTCEDGFLCVKDIQCDDFIFCPFWHAKIRNYPDQCCFECYKPTCQEFQELATDGCTAHPYHPCKVLVTVPGSFFKDYPFSTGIVEKGSDNCCEKAVCDKNDPNCYTIEKDPVAFCPLCSDGKIFTTTDPKSCCPGECYEPCCPKPEASCKDRCGKIAIDGSCWCDNYCNFFKDCCCDFEEHCGCGTPGHTCEGKCGTISDNRACYCDCACYYYKDCCCDKNQWCPVCDFTPNSEAEAMASSPERVARPLSSEA